MAFKTLDDLDVRGKKVFVRADLNVPIKDGVVTDLTRVKRSAQTVSELLNNGAAVILASHFGRPKGKIVPEMSLSPLVEPLSECLGGRKVILAPDCVGPEVDSKAAALQFGQVLLLENLRFHEEEEKNDCGFAQALSQNADIYINDAFSTAHRAHASTEAMAKLLPCAAGRLMQAELNALNNALEAPERPVVAIVGGAKVSTKLDLLGNLVKKVDTLVIGGAMANTFLAAQGFAVGKSLCESSMYSTALNVLKTAEACGCSIVLPSDVVVASEFAANAPSEVVRIDCVPEDKMILDAGPASIDNVIGILSESKTLLWNGPFGAFELKPFDEATNKVARGAADLTAKGCLLSVAGGGDTVAAMVNAGVAEEVTYMSTAGGAFLEWLEGKTLLGIAVLG